MVYLTGPVHTLADFQVEYNGLLLGPQTQYIVEPGQDFMNMAAIKSMDQSRTWADGAWSGPDFADVLLPQMPVTVWGATQTVFNAALSAFQNIFSPQLVAQPLWVKYPGIPAQGIPAKVNQRVLPLLQASLTGAVRGSIQFRCPDPQWQSVPRTITLNAAGTSVSGLAVPLFATASGSGFVSPGFLDFGSTTTSSSAGTLTNSGNTPAWPVVVLNGPTTVPATVQVDGNAVTYSQPIPAGQSVTIDYKTGRATLTGGVDRTYALTSRMFSAVSSSSPVFYNADGGTATVTIADVSR